MAPSHRFPVVTWKDHSGSWTAVVVENDEWTAVARTAKQAREQLADYLDWLYRRESWRGSPEAGESTLHWLTIAVRPEYRTEQRRYPCAEEIDLRVPYVLEILATGMFRCTAPTIGVQFYFHQERGQLELLPHYVRQRLNGLTPRQLSRYSEPLEVEKHELVVRVPSQERQRSPKLALPNLESVAESLQDRLWRRQLGPAWERDHEALALAKRILDENASILIVGSPGCGKTTVLTAAVRHVERLVTLQRGGNGESSGESPQRGEHRAPQFWSTSAARLMAGMKYLGQWEERCEGVIRELSSIGGVLCVENALDLVRSGGERPQSSAAAFLATYMQHRELRVIMEASPEEVDACRRLLPGFLDLCLVFHVPDLSRTAARSVLDHLAADHARNRQITVARGVTEQIVEAFGRFMPYYAFPGRAAAFLADLYDAARREHVTEIDLTRTWQRLSQRTGLPEIFLRDDLPLHPNDIERFLQSRVLGQPVACHEAARVLTAFKTGVADPRRPMGTLLLCGPTGVGKTELAKALGDFCFGHGDSRDRLLRLDMSEYSGPNAAQRLVTSPDGEPSSLIRRVRQQPFQVVLLDEIEKANPEVFDVLMTLFDEGRLTDRFGRVTDFRSSLIVMTSNLGAGGMAAIGFGPAKEVQYHQEALAFFRPEFFNRIDRIVPFQPLTESTIHEVTRKELAGIAEREGLKGAGLELRWTEEVVAHLSRVGFDPRYGARPLQRALELAVVAPISRLRVQRPDLRNMALCLEVRDGQVQLAGTDR